jgi:hypothetical protein
MPVSILSYGNAGRESTLLFILEARRNTVVCAMQGPIFSTMM